MSDRPIDRQFPERLHPFLTFALKKGDDRFWKLNAPTPRSTKDAVLFSGPCERLDAECLISSNTNYLRSQLKANLLVGLLGRCISIFLCFSAIAMTIKTGNLFFLLFFIPAPVFELATIRGFMKYRLHFEPRICFSRKDDAVLAVDYLGNLHKILWKDVTWYILLNHHYGLGGSAGDTYAINCSVVNQTSATFYKFLNPVYEIYSHSEEDSMQRLEGIYNFIHYYMEHGLEAVKTAYASDDFIDEGKLPCGVTLMRPSPPFKPDKQFSSRSDLIKDIVWRFVFFPFYPKLLLDIRPQLKKFPFEETGSSAE